MPNLNKVMLMGNLTRDAELKYTPKGTAVVDIGLAINRKWSQDGATREETTFVDITLFGRTAEVLAEYTTKGSPVMVEGRLQTDAWEDKETGKKRTKLKVIGDHIQLLGKRDGSGSAPRGSAPADDEEDDIPF